jgi:hypothetical protein
MTYKYINMQKILGAIMKILDVMETDRPGFVQTCEPVCCGKLVARVFNVATTFQYIVLI